MYFREGRGRGRRRETYSCPAPSMGPDGMTRAQMKSWMLRTV